MFDNPKYSMSLQEVLRTEDYKDGTILSSSQLIPYINELGKNLVVAEIGVAFGLNMINTIDKCSIVKYIAIDPHQAYQDWGPDVSYGAMSEQTMSRVGDKFLENLEAYDKKHVVQYIKKTSDDAKDDIKDESLDFLFIDGNHATDFVYSDCVNYWPKIKKGGIMSGHDWDGAPVKEGVRRFLDKVGIDESKLTVVYNRNTPPCWMIIKE